MRPHLAIIILAVIAGLSFNARATAETAGTPSQDAAPSLKLDIFPPWQNGANTDVTNKGLEFTEPDADNLADFHGDLTDPKLVLYVGGNYFFAMAPLVKRFEELHPEFKGRIYWETIPPGLLAKQIQAGGTITSGNMTWTVKPDAYFAGLMKVKQYVGEGMLVAPAVPYVTNTLTIMVPKGNPAHITGLADLAKPGVRLVMPNPKFEGIARQIKAALTRVGGEALTNAVYETKVKDGSALLTHIHHRQSPIFLMQGRADAGVTWLSEALFQEEIGHPIEHVDIPEAMNSTAIYAGAVAAGAPHPEAAKMWLDFIRSPDGLKIFEHYGFKPYQGKDG